MRNSYLRRLALFVLVMGGCVNLPHKDPKPRGQVGAALAAVDVEVDCGGSLALFWSDNKSGSGVMISERHVLTAQHVVACPTIPNVHVSYQTGNGRKRIRMYVTREDEKQDIARLEIASAENFNLDIIPPLTGTPQTHDLVCAWPGDYNQICGIVSFDPTAVWKMDAVKGASGAGVYNQGLNTDGYGSYTDREGEFNGIVIRKGDGYTRIAPVDATWLEGT